MTPPPTISTDGKIPERRRGRPDEDRAPDEDHPQRDAEHGRPVQAYPPPTGPPDPARPRLRQERQQRCRAPALSPHGELQSLQVLGTQAEHSPAPQGSSGADAAERIDTGGCAPGALSALRRAHPVHGRQVDPGAAGASASAASAEPDRAERRSDPALRGTPGLRASPRGRQGPRCSSSQSGEVDDGGQRGSSRARPDRGGTRSPR